MVEVILVRHAATAWSGVRYCGVSDPPLSPTGLGEARWLAATLAGDLPPNTRIVSSPSRRAVATASAIVDAGRLPGVELDPRWREADVGVAEGRTFEELELIAPGSPRRSRAASSRSIGRAARRRHRSRSVSPTPGGT